MSAFSQRIYILVSGSLLSLGLLTAAGNQKTSAPPAELLEALQKVQAMLSKPLSERAEKWKCNLKSQHHCSPESGCAPTTPSTWLYVSFKDKKYSRCDRDGCDAYDFVSSVSGAWTKITVPSYGMLLTIRNDGGSFTETASKADEVWTGFGKCVAQSN